MSAGTIMLAVPAWAFWVHYLAGLVILAEALNKLDRVRRFHDCNSARECTTEALKAVAWFLLALGGAGILVRPLLIGSAPTLESICTSIGFAVLIVRTRVKEG